LTAVVLRNARVVGGSGAPCEIEVSDGLIASIRPVSSAQIARSPGAGEVVELDGRWVLPGLWDHHVHFEQWAIARTRIDLSSAGSAAEAATAVATAAARVPPDRDLVVGVGFRDAMWPDEPTVELLDRHTGETATVLVSGDLHSAWLNSAARRRFAQPETAAGLLREQAAFDIQLAVADLPRGRVDELVADAAEAAAARGVVGIVDFEWPDVGPCWQHRIAAGLTALRVRCSVWPQRLDAAIGRGLRTGDPLDAVGLATMGPLKVIIDGSLNTRTAYCFQAYPGDDGASGHGLLTVEPDELVHLLTRAQAAGLTAAVHAIGDHANSIALDAFERASSEPSRRSSIEHAQLLTERDIERMAGLGLVASVQPEHAVDDRDVADRFWAGRTGSAFAYRSLLDAGVPLALGSDAPVAPLDPWVAIAAAVHRSRTDRPPWHPEQQISTEAALRASSHTTVEVGRSADLVVVEHDPLRSRPDELRAMPVAATMLSGRWTYRLI
jgi:predicted amidohydrolase YtcJ